MLKLKLHKSLGSAVLFMGFQAIAAYGVVLFLSRQIPQVEFSLYLLSFTWALVTIQLVDLAFEQCFSSYKYKSDVSTQKLFASMYFTKLFVCCTAILVLLISSSVFSLQIPVQFLFFLIPILNPLVIFELRGRLALLSKILLLEKLVYLAMLIAHIYLFGMGITVYALYAIVSIASLLLQFKILNLSLPRFSDFQGYLIRRYVKLYWPVYISLSSLIVIGIGSRLVIEQRLGILVFASVSLCFQLTNLVNIVHSQIEKYMRPLVSQAVADKTTQVITSLLNDYFYFYLLPVASFCLLVGAFSAEIVVFIFGEPWVDAGSFLKILIYLSLTGSVIKISDILLVAVSQVKFSLYLNICAATVLTWILLNLNDQADTRVYLLSIVLVAALQACLLGGYAFIKIKTVSNKSI
jgi:O-antigen/teichoic acid export membrane protein